jgi:hypothetical protein
MTSDLIPTVSFGKYKDKSVTELLTDKKYIEWLKNQSWFQNHKQIYNIVVNQTINSPDTNNAKTPEHNKLQNLFLEKDNQYKFISKYCAPINYANNKIKCLFTDKEFIRLFGTNEIPQYKPGQDNVSVIFEEKFNWDLVMYYGEDINFDLASNSAIDNEEKSKHEEIYYNAKEHLENLKLFDSIIAIRKQIDADIIKNYETKMNEYVNDNNKYEENVKLFVQRKKQYDNDIKLHEKKRYEFVIHKKKEICNEFGIAYADYIAWNIDDPVSKSEKQMREMMNGKMQSSINEFDATKPEYPGAPIKPQVPSKDINTYLNIPTNHEHYATFDKFRKIGRYYSELPPIKNIMDGLETYKSQYCNNFNWLNTKQREKYYYDMIRCFLGGEIDVAKNDKYDNYKIKYYTYYSRAVCCELKPILGDDYPCVLRKLKSQIKLSENYKKNHNEQSDKFGGYSRKKYCLIIGNFASEHTSKEQLEEIFNQSDIEIIYADDIFNSATGNISKNESVAISHDTVNIEHHENEKAITNSEIIVKTSDSIEHINNTGAIIANIQSTEFNNDMSDKLHALYNKVIQLEDRVKQLENEILLSKPKKRQAKKVDTKANKT